MAASVARRAVVVGLGASGAAVVRTLRTEGWDVVVVEDHEPLPGSEAASRVATARAAGAVVLVEPVPGVVADAVADAELVVPSPGVDVRHVALAAAAQRGVTVRGEIELAWERAVAPIVAITGTNGKASTSALVAGALTAIGRRVVVAGAGGEPLLDAVGRDADVLVVPVSSAQLEHTSRFRPRVAVHLNQAPPPQEPPGSLAGHAAAKARFAGNLTADDLLVVNLDDPWSAAMAGDVAARVDGVTLVPGSAGAWRPNAPLDDADAALVDPAGRVVVAVADLPLRLPHQILDALAAAAVAADLGVDHATIAGVLATAVALPHRTTLVGRWNGRTFYDDAEATNPHATVAAVRAFPSVVLLAGGSRPGPGLDRLRDVASHLRAVVTFGEAASEVEAVLHGLVHVQRAGSAREAVALAAADAREDDVVLLSPACPPDDPRRSADDVGADFIDEVHRLAGDAPDTATPTTPGGDAAHPLDDPWEGR
jgi:UDP-N-acetylmuramoylalanine--D-glutamate ligase